MVILGSKQVLERLVQCFPGTSIRPEWTEFSPEIGLPSKFRVSDLATASFANFAAAIDVLRQAYEYSPQPFSIDRRLACTWFQQTYQPIGWISPDPWDPIAGNYRTQDGWIRLHTNAPKHRVVVESILGGANDREAVARQVRRWSGEELESVIVDAGGCAAKLYSHDDWLLHPHGRYFESQHLIERFEGLPTVSTNWRPELHRPLQGIRVLDLTRILAGPVATRALASLGADVLRIDPLDWDEPAVEPDLTVGKHCARLDIKSSEGRQMLEILLQQADILISGYRPDALANLGFSWQERQNIRPGLVDVTLNAYGWIGPWSTRRGFDSLVQMSTGIVHQCSPNPDQELSALPVQALDHATGYLMASAAILGLAHRHQAGTGSYFRSSLAAMAKLLLDIGHSDSETSPIFLSERDWLPSIEQSAFGPLRRLPFPIVHAETEFSFGIPARRLGTDRPQFS